MPSRLPVMVFFSLATQVPLAPCLPSAPCSPFPGMLSLVLLYIFIVCFWHENNLQEIWDSGLFCSLPNP